MSAETSTYDSGAENYTMGLDAYSIDLRDQEESPVSIVDDENAEFTPDEEGDQMIGNPLEAGDTCEKTKDDLEEFNEALREYQEMFAEAVKKRDGALAALALADQLGESELAEQLRAAVGNREKIEADFLFTVQFIKDAIKSDERVPNAAHKMVLAGRALDENTSHLGVDFARVSAELEVGIMQIREAIRRQNIEDLAVRETA